MNRGLSCLRSGPLKALVVRLVVPFFDVLLSPLTLVGALLLKSLRRVGVWRLPVSKAIFNAVGVFPIRDHYYEPLFNPRHLHRPLGKPRPLPGIDLNVSSQLQLLECFDYADELDRLPRHQAGARFYYANPNLPPADSEFLYCAVRYFRPARVLEIGSGFSTLMMLEAIERNRSEDPSYACRLTCVEPYEMPWLDRLPGLEVLRERVELLDPGILRSLGANDILFIDSSHVVRPQGDVVHLFLELLPHLARGVLVHVHDIFTPHDYPPAWIVDEVRLWNEQYLLEAFLTCNDRFRILAALNLLARRHPERLAAKFPVFREQGGGNPGSLWLVTR